MRFLFAALALAAVPALVPGVVPGAIPGAHAQVVIQAPPIAGPGAYGGPYWRGPGEGEWRHRREIREEYRRQDWRRDHCVRDFRGEVYCRR